MKIKLTKYISATNVEKNVEIYYKNTINESLSIRILYKITGERDIWSVEIKKMINIRLNQNDNFYLKDYSSNLTEEEFNNKLKECIDFLNKTHE